MNPIRQGALPATRRRSLPGITTAPPGRRTPSRRFQSRLGSQAIETTHGVLAYSELSPLLAERVLRVEAALYQLEFASWPPDERLAAEFHRRTCFDLLPDWAGRWRTIEVRVGNLTPTPPHQVALRMREYGADLIARWPAAAASVSDLTLELLQIRAALEVGERAAHSLQPSPPRPGRGQGEVSNPAPHRAGPFRPETRVCETENHELPTMLRMVFDQTVIFSKN
jgi:hypothetical protein